MTAANWRQRQNELLQLRPVGNKSQWNVGAQQPNIASLQSATFNAIQYQGPGAGGFTAVNAGGAHKPFVDRTQMHRTKDYDTTVAPLLSGEMVSKQIKDLLEDMNEVTAKRRKKGKGKKASEEISAEEENELADAFGKTTLEDGDKAKEEVKDEDGVDPFAEEEEEEDEGEEVEEPDFVEGLDVRLLPHQVEGLDWLLNCESGKRRGGILADDMGLGKTIQSIALILSHPHPKYALTDSAHVDGHKKLPKDMSRATLIVAPLGLIKQWESELKSKTTSLPVDIRVEVHHGTNRTKEARKLARADVVITTYPLVASEEKNGGPLMEVNWWRIILDEAHTIKNSTAKGSQACFNLKGRYRWCLTGTPIQNNLGELQSLFRFLKIKPFDDLPTWKDQIEKPMKNGKQDLAMERLRAVLSKVLLRRTKKVLVKKEQEKKAAGEEGGNAMLNLPERIVKSVVCEFAPGERAFYDKLQEKTAKKLAQLRDGEKLTHYTGALVLLLRLRQACNHPQLLVGKVTKDAEALEAVKPQSVDPNAPAITDGEFDELSNMLGGLKVEQTKTCDICLAELSPADGKAGKERCPDCIQDLAILEKAKRKEKEERRASKGKTTKKPIRVSAAKRFADPEDSDEADESFVSGVSEDPTLLELSDDSLDSDVEDSLHFPSSKITQLLKILKHEIANEHKVIVFSQFTSMLDLIEPFLRSARISYSRYDGSMRNDLREASLARLKAPCTSSTSVDVLLCSLKCGAVGLNLTAASRVVLLEPFWNPAIEEQAIDRVHRFGQTRDVIVYKFSVRGTVEERVLELQERKRELIQAAMAEGKLSAMSKLGSKELLRLFERTEAEVRAPALMSGNAVYGLGPGSKGFGGPPVRQNLPPGSRVIDEYRTARDW